MLQDIQLWGKRKRGAAIELELGTYTVRSKAELSATETIDMVMIFRLLLALRATACDCVIPAPQCWHLCDVVLELSGQPACCTTPRASGGWCNCLCLTFFWAVMSCIIVFLSYSYTSKTCTAYTARQRYLHHPPQPLISWCTYIASFCLAVCAWNLLLQLNCPLDEIISYSVNTLSI